MSEPEEQPKPSEEDAEDAAETAPETEEAPETDAPAASGPVISITPKAKAAEPEDDGESAEDAKDGKSAEAAEAKDGEGAVAAKDAAGDEGADGVGQGHGHGHGGHGPPPGEEPRWLDHPENVQKIIRGFWVCCALLIVPDLLEFMGVVHFKHPHEGFEVQGYYWENFVGFFAIYGFVACVVLVLIAKQMRKVVMREEDYYDE